MMAVKTPLHPSIQIDLHIFDQYVFSEKVQGHDLNAAGQTIFAN